MHPQHRCHMAVYPEPSCLLVSQVLIGRLHRCYYLVRALSVPGVGTVAGTLGSATMLWHRPVVPQHCA